MRPLLLVLIAACYSPELSQTPACGPNDVCPADRLCLRGVCVISDCSSHDNGTVCSTRSVADGVCFDDRCVPPGCGDGVLEAPEICDDGNRSDRDGCSAACDSTETCGNDIIDFSKGEQCDDARIGVSNDGCSAACTVEFDSWEPAVPDVLLAREEQMMAFDASRNVLVMFGGYLGTSKPEIDDTWEWDGDGWVRAVTPVHPKRTSAAALVYDSKRKHVVFAGGGSQSSETWTWDGLQWTQNQTATSPPGGRCSGAYDVARDKVVLFSSIPDGTSSHGQTWEFDGTNWAKLSTPTGPPAVQDATLAYDSIRDVTVLVTITSQTWEWNGTSWTQKANAPQQPLSSNLIFDPDRARVVFASGTALHEWNGSAWTTRSNVTLVNHTRARGAYDTFRHELVIFGGTQFGDRRDLETNVVEMDGDVRIHARRFDTPDASTSMASYDGRRGRVLLFGGNTGQIAPNGSFILSNSIWEQRGESWVERRAPAALTPRQSALFVFDPIRNVAVVFGGTDAENTFLVDTWEWDGSSWTERATTGTKPPPRLFPAAAFDRKNGRVVMVGGGGDGVAILDDAWAWNGTWSQIPAQGDKPDTVGGKLVFDTKNNRLLLMGGAKIVGNPPTLAASTDVWQLDGATWTKLATTNPPPGRFLAAAAFDEARGTVVVTTGLSSTEDLFADAWELDGLEWHARAALAPAFARSRGAMVYDAIGRRLVFAGGENASSKFFDAWYLRFRSFDKAPVEACLRAVDDDKDGAVGCADRDCWGRCAPSCAPNQTTCATNVLRCGDGSCNAFIEDKHICPADCS